MSATRSVWMLGFIALCFALGGFRESQAASITITGAHFGADGIPSFPGYGTSISQHNVVNFSPSGISDPTWGTAWLTQGNLTSSAVFSNVPNYKVDWYFNGAESGDTNRFVSGPLGFTESNQNNRNQSGNDPGWSFVGTTSGTGVGSPIPFTLNDLTRSIGVSNGANHKPGEFIASLMFAFVQPTYNYYGQLLSWVVTSQATDWFAFGFDDPGSRNDNHDDYVGIGHVIPSPVPLPAALPLMASVLAGGYFVGRWRRRRAHATALPFS